jgi:integrase
MTPLGGPNRPFLAAGPTPITTLRALDIVAWRAGRNVKPSPDEDDLDPEAELAGRDDASWLLGGGADLQVVKERLGHVSIATTEKYLHTLPEADETALAALNRIRRRRA